MRNSPHVNLKNNLKLTDTDHRPACRECGWTGNPKRAATNRRLSKTCSLSQRERVRVRGQRTYLDNQIVCGPVGLAVLPPSRGNEAHYKFRMRLLLPPPRFTRRLRVSADVRRPPHQPKTMQKSPFSGWNRSEPSAKFFRSEGRSRGPSYCCRSSAESLYKSPQIGFAIPAPTFLNFSPAQVPVNQRP